MSEARNTKNSKNRRGTSLSANLPMAMAQAVYEQVRDGHYGSAGAVVRAGLQLLLKLDEEGLPLPPAGDDPDPDAPKGSSRRRSG